MICLEPDVRVVQERISFRILVAGVRIERREVRHGVGMALATGLHSVGSGQMGCRIVEPPDVVRSMAVGTLRRRQIPELGQFAMQTQTIAIRQVRVTIAAATGQLGAELRRIGRVRIMSFMAVGTAWFAGLCRRPEPLGQPAARHPPYRHGRSSPVAPPGSDGTCRSSSPRWTDVTWSVCRPHSKCRGHRDSPSTRRSPTGPTWSIRCHARSVRTSRDRLCGIHHRLCT